MGKCGDATDGHWKRGETSREEDQRGPRVNTAQAHIRGTLLLLLFILFGIDCKAAQVVFRHMVDGMDHFVGYLLGLLCS